MEAGPKVCNIVNRALLGKRLCSFATKRGMWQLLVEIMYEYGSGWCPMWLMGHLEWVYGKTFVKNWENSLGQLDMS